MVFILYSFGRYYDTYLPFVLEACNDESPEVRQAAVYGLGVCAEFGGSVFKPLVGGMIYFCPLVVFRGLIHTLQLSNSCFLFNRGSVKIKCCDTAAKCSAI